MDWRRPSGVGSANLLLGHNSKPNVNNGRESPAYETNGPSGEKGAVVASNDHQISVIRPGRTHHLARGRHRAVQRVGDSPAEETAIMSNHFANHFANPGIASG